MELTKDKPRSIKWFGAHHSWRLQMGFSKMAQQKDGMLTSSWAGQPSSPAGWGSKLSQPRMAYWEKLQGSGLWRSQVEEALMGK